MAVGEWSNYGYIRIDATDRSGKGLGLMAEGDQPDPNVANEELDLKGFYRPASEAEA